MEGAIRRLAKRVKALRAAAGISQQAAAERAGCSYAQIQAIERGITNPTLTILVAVAKAYGINLSKLFEGV